LWNPYTLGGYPFVANLLPNTFYPFNWILLLIKPENVSGFFGFIFLIHFFLGSYFMYLFLRKIKISKFGSFIGAFIYLFSTKFVFFIWAGHPNKATTIMLIPLIFLLIENFFEKRTLTSAILISLALTLEFLGSHPQLFLYLCLVVLFYFVFKLVISFKEQKNKKLVTTIAIYFVLIFVFTILLSSIQLLPSLDFSKNNIRYGGTDFDFVSSLSYEPWTLVTMLIPDFFGSYLNNTFWGTYGFWNKSLYIGILPLIFVFFSLFRLKNKHALFFFLLSIFSLLFAMGKYSPVLYFFYNIPGFNIFRIPTRMLLFFNFSVIVLAVYGLDFLLTKDWESNKKKLLNKIPKILLVLSAIVLIFTFLIFLMKAQTLGVGKYVLDKKFDPENSSLHTFDFYLDKLNMAYDGILNGFILFTVFFILSSLVIVYLYKSKPKLRFIKYAIILLIFFDLGLYSIRHIDVKDPNDVFIDNEIINFLENDMDYYRILDTTLYLMPQQITIRNNIFKMNGYDPMIPVDYQRYVSIASGIKIEKTTLIPLEDIKYPLMYDLMNVKYVITNNLLKNEQYKLVEDIKTYTYVNKGINFIYGKKIEDKNFEFISEQKTYLYENLNVFPRAYIVPNAVIVGNREEILNILVDGNLNMKSYVILEKNPNKPLTNEGSFKEANIKFYSPNKIIINAEMDNPGYLVLADNYDDGWKAYDNGKEVEIYRSNYISRSVYLEKGKHELIFMYEPKSYKIGKFISIITFAVLLLLLLSGFYLKKKA
jgi:hypothetical protein